MFSLLLSCLLILIKLLYVLYNSNSPCSRIVANTNEQKDSCEKHISTVIVLQNNKVDYKNKTQYSLRGVTLKCLLNLNMEHCTTAVENYCRIICRGRRIVTLIEEHKNDSEQKKLENENLIQLHVY